MLVVAAVFGLISWRRGQADLAAVVAGAAFAVALAAELYLLRRRPDRLWYDGRAAAESAKTLTWRYLVGGNPFGLTEVSEEEAERLLLHRFRQVAAELRGAHLVPISDADDQIGPALRRVRSLPLEERRALYRSGRIGAQQAWYRGKARWNERRATQWSLVLTGLEVLGLGGAVLKAMGAVGFDLLGLASALVGAGRGLGPDQAAPEPGQRVRGCQPGAGGHRRPRRLGVGRAGLGPLRRPGRGGDLAGAHHLARLPHLEPAG